MLSTLHRWLEQQLRALRDFWYRLSGVTRLFSAVGASLLIAGVVSSVTYPWNGYAVRARTSVVSVEPSCGRQMVWDLPSGTFAATSSQEAPPAVEVAAKALPRQAASVRVSAGARARLERVGDGGLSIWFDRSPHFTACATADAVVEVAFDESHQAAPLRIPRSAVGTDRILYRSGDAATPADATRSAGAASGDTPALEFVLLLEGRIVVGTELQQGAGWHDAAAAAYLDGADVQVRTVNFITDQSVTMIDERVDAGGVIDSAPCFDNGLSWFDSTRLLFDQPSLAFPTPAQRQQACVRALAGPAFGLTRPHKEGSMDAQVQASGHRLGVTSHQGRARLLGTTLWQVITHSHLVQALVVLVVLLGGADTALRRAYEIHTPPDGTTREHARSAQPAGPGHAAPIRTRPPRSRLK